MPVIVMALNGDYPVDDFVIDENQGAKLVHYIGTFGNLKALITFVDKFKMDLSAQDTHG